MTLSTPSTTELFLTLAGVSPDAALTEALQVRADVLAHALASGEALFVRADFERLALNVRLAFALATSEVHHDARLSAHYRKRLLAAGGQPKASTAQQRALVYVQNIAAAPATASAHDLDALQAAGWSEDAIVTITQIVAFTSFQSRLVSGLRIISGERDSPGGQERMIGAGHWNRDPLTRSGKTAPTQFSRAELDWAPWITPRSHDSLQTDEAAQLRRDGHLDSPYFMLLARELTLLDHRTRADKAIFYTQGGLPRAERELAATITSKVNGCIYCASVHARKAAQLVHASDSVDRLLNVAPGHDLAQDQSPRWQAITRFSAQLAATPHSAQPAHIASLKAQGLDTLAQFDLVASVAFFSWANRLMLTLGEPFVPTPQPEKAAPERR